MSVIIIAEAGVNHCGDIQIAKKLIDVAADAGADYVKYQTYRAESIVTRLAIKAEYQNKTTGSALSQYDMLKHLELSFDMHVKLIEHCSNCGIGFLSAPFDIQSVDILQTLGLSVIKIPSGEITNLPYLRHIGRLGSEVILSTGMASMGDVEAAIAALENAGTPRDRIVALHCTTEYPAPMSEVNLRAMQTLRKAFDVRVGYSDHTTGIVIPIAAVAMGATVIEKHFTLDRNLPGPDHLASLEPHELKAMVVAIRNVEQAMGDGIKRLTPSEAKNRPVARKSIVAGRAISAGEVFSVDNLAAKRPGTGISPMCWDNVVGRRASRNFDADELIVL